MLRSHSNKSTRKVTWEYVATALVQLCFLVVLAYFLVFQFFQSKLKANTNEAAVTALCYTHMVGQLRPLHYGNGTVSQAPGLEHKQLSLSQSQIDSMV